MTASNRAPILRDDCWECPECGWQNPYSASIIDTYPPITCYRCKTCEYHHDTWGVIPAGDRFAAQFPGGKAREVQEKETP